MVNLATLQPMSEALREVAESQDRIGWVEFLHGKVSTKFRKIQQAHCIMAGTRISGDDWITHSTRQLIEISHAQWIYRNFTLHHYTKGYLRLQTVNTIRWEVEELADTRPSKIPKESCYLLEISLRPNKLTLDIEDAYWVAAMKVAKKGLWQRKRAAEKQRARAQRTTTKTSRNLLNRQLHVYKQTKKQPGEQKGHAAKMQRNKKVATGTSQPNQRTLITFWERLYPDVFIFG